MAKEFCPLCGESLRWIYSVSCMDCSKTFCHDCTIKYGDDLCLKCGKERIKDVLKDLEKNKICPRCGKKLDLSFNVCPYCATKVKDKDIKQVKNKRR